MWKAVRRNFCGAGTNLIPMFPGKAGMMRRKSQPNEVISGCGFHHVAIRTADWERSLRFWQEGMGFRLAVQWSDPPRRACMLDTGDGNYLEIFERDPAEGIPSEAAILHFCFRTDDLSASLERARAAGAEVTLEPKTVDVFGERIGTARIAFFKGPDGEICELFENEVL
jgi:glyoxylase I family protein